MPCEPLIGATKGSTIIVSVQDGVHRLQALSISVPNLMFKCSDVSMPRFGFKHWILRKFESEDPLSCLRESNPVLATPDITATTELGPTPNPWSKPGGMQAPGPEFLAP